jgi:hypothetical protein
MENVTIEEVQENISILKLKFNSKQSQHTNDSLGETVIQIWSVIGVFIRTSPTLDIWTCHPLWLITTEMSLSHSRLIMGNPVWQAEKSGTQTPDPFFWGLPLYFVFILFLQHWVLYSGIMLARQMLYHLSYVSSPCIAFFNTWLSRLLWKGN